VPKQAESSGLHHGLDQRAVRPHQQHPRSCDHRCRRDDAPNSGPSMSARPSRRPRGIQDGSRPTASNSSSTSYPAIGDFICRRRQPRQAGAHTRSPRQRRRIFASGRNRRSERETHEHSVVFTVTLFRPGAFRPTSRTRCSTGSRVIPTARGIRGAGLGLSLVRSFCRNCTEARCASRFRLSAEARP